MKWKLLIKYGLLRTLLRRNNDDQLRNSKLYKVVTLLNPSLGRELMSSSNNQVRYFNYMIQRVNNLLSQGKVEKSIYIQKRLIERSFTFQSIPKISIKLYLNEIMDQINIVIFAIFLLALGGAEIIAEATPPIIVEDSSNGPAPFVTLVIIIITILMVITKPEESLPILGPMTESEYDWLQDTLAYQAWLENLSLSPIGELWKLPFERTGNT